jgi:hypothetical protein
LTSAQDVRQRLTKCLEKLAKIRPTDLTREESLGPLNFRGGIPFFDRTLSFYRQISSANLTRVPAAILEIAANHAEESLHQFEQIEQFNPAGIERPEQIRNLLINDVRDTHATIYEDLCILLAPSRNQAQKLTRGSPMPTMILLAIVLFVAILAYRSSLYATLIRDLQDFAHNLLAHR